MKTALTAFIVACGLLLIGSSGASAQNPLSPIIGVTPAGPIDFGRVCLGQSADQEIGLFNANPDPASILEITALDIGPSPDFTIAAAPPLPISIAGGEPPVPVILRFTPQAPGPAAGTLSITAPQATNTPFNVQLNGVGNSPPTCSAGGPYAGNQGEPIQFNGTATDPDGGQITYEWDFGDGGQGAGPNPIHTYTTCGPFVVTLTVSDDCGAQSVCTADVDVNCPPECDAGGPYAGNQGEPIQFDGSNSTDPDGDPLTYAWDFGDGGQGAGATPTHTYTTCGPFVVTLTVSDPDGLRSVCTTDVDVNCPPVCDAGGPYNGQVNQPIQFDGSNSTDPDGDPLTYAWDFGDGGQGAGATPTHTYASPGGFTVTLTVTDPDGLLSTCETRANITEQPNEPPRCDAGGPYSGIEGQPVQFDGSNSTDPDGTIVTYDWDFGDGSTAPNAGPTPSHTYGAAGSYVVELCVTDDRGATTCCTTDAVIEPLPNEPPRCDVGGPYAGIEGQPVQFDGSNSTDPDGTIVTYDWDFGDGSTAPDAGPTPSHTYGAAGTFTVTLCVTDDRQATSCCETQAVIEPRPNEPPRCDAGGPYAGTVGQPVDFDGSNSTDPDGTIVTYDWDFGDGSTAPDAGPTPSHTYGAVGTFTVTLCVTDDRQATSCCETTAEISEVPNEPPRCDAGGPYAGIEGQPVQFDGSNSTDPDGTIVTYDWDFGDGSTAPDAGPTPSHTYGAAGTFTVTLCVTDDRQATSCCETQAVIEPRPNEPPRCDAGGPYSGEAGQPVDFDGSNSTDPDGMIVTYDWDFGDGSTAPDAGPTPTHTYANPGMFTVTLCVTDDRQATSCCETLADIIVITSVELASFTATSDDGTVTLNWRTSFEDMNLGFDVQRAEEGSVAFVTVNEQMIEGQGDSPGAYSFTDRTATPGTTYDYQLVAYDLRGGHEAFGPIQVTVSLVAPKQISLGKNKPNPFNPSTTITFALPEATRVTLRVYNAQGQLVRTLVDDVRGAAEHSVEWDGRDDRGNALSTGVYLYRLEAGSTVLQNKMVLAK